MVIEKENIELFSNQREHFDYEFNKSSKKYGSSFIFSSDNGIFLIYHCLFMHNILALEHLKLIEIESLYILDYDKDPKKQREQYNAKITLLPKFTIEYKEGQEAKKTNILVKDEDAEIKEIVNEIEKYDTNIGMVIDTLERRFQALVENKKPVNFDMVNLDYINYLGRNRIISKIIEKLNLKNKISKEVFNNLCIDFATSNIGQAQDFTIPLFLTKKTNQKNNSKQEILDFYKNEIKEFKEAKAEGRGFFPHEIGYEDFREDDFFETRKLHNDIMEELTDLKNKKKEEKAITKPIFNNNDGVLLFKDTKFDFSRKYNQKDLLAVLFKAPQKNWYYDEIQDEWDDKAGLLEIKKTKGYWRKFYTAGDEINQQIAVEIGVKDFIIKSTKQARINPKYT